MKRAIVVMTLLFLPSAAFAQNKCESNPDPTKVCETDWIVNQGYKACPDEWAIKGIECAGGHCRRKKLYCYPHLMGPNPNRLWSPWFSTADYDNAREPFANYNQGSANGVAIGIECRGARCGEMRIERLSGFISVNYCQRSPFFSEEQKVRSGIGNKFICPYPGDPADGNGYVVGVACQGSKCDNISLLCCLQQEGQPTAQTKPTDP